MLFMFVLVAMLIYSWLLGLSPMLLHLAPYIVAI
jgi:hypothetical protein